VIGDRGLKDGKIEYQGRRDTEATLLPVEDAAQAVIDKIKASLAH
jgi:prolyl-tRNA synthetase